MQLTLTSSAAQLYINEMELKSGDCLRLFVRIGGVGSGGFSVGVMRDVPTATAYTIIHNDVTFFVEEDDFWYIDGISIDFNEDLGYLDIKHPTFLDMDHPEE